MPELEEVLGTAPIGRIVGGDGQVLPESEGVSLTFEMMHTLVRDREIDPTNDHNTFDFYHVKNYCFMKTDPEDPEIELDEVDFVMDTIGLSGQGPYSEVWHPVKKMWVFGEF